MRRRGFLQKSILGAAALTLPTWLGCAFGSKSEWAFDDEDFQQGSTLATVYLRAQKRGKPLLVLIIPPYPYSREQLNSLSHDAKTKYWDVTIERDERGHAFGELLNHGTKEQRWPLALCEVVCALPEEVGLLTGSFSGLPLMALIETDSIKPSTARSFDEELPSHYRSYQSALGWEEQQKSEDKIIEERIALLAKLCKEALAPDAKTLERRATQARAALTTEQKGLEKKILAKSLTVPEGDAIAALVAEVANKSKEPKLFSLLAQAVDDRLCKPPIEGSRWGRASGCGTSYETPEEPKMKVNADGSYTANTVIVVTGCGMGHVPEKSVRFLSFYTEESV
jgi:hypothetical protein